MQFRLYWIHKKQPKTQTEAAVLEVFFANVFKILISICSQ